MKFFISFLSLIFSFHFSFAGSPFSNLANIQRGLGFSKYYSQENGGRRLRVAVLDKGFYGYEKELGQTLPTNTRYVPGPIANPEDMKVEHGLKMAQILVGLMTNDLKATQWMPELTLYNVFGFSNFKAAIDDIIAKKVDLVLYSEVWEYGGNFDGAGFINNEINRATRNGVIWVNAAGNFALTTYNSKITTLADDWVKLPDQNNALSLRCEVKSGTCPVKIVLSWNDFKSDVELGTDKDLDVALTDDLLNIVQSSALKQSSDPKEARPGYSKYPREIISAELSSGNYFIRVKNRSKNFGDNDQLRITVDGEGIVMPSHSVGETILNPADNNSVITVGASDSDRSSFSFERDKPDLLAPSSLRLADKKEFRGSSNAAAIVAAGFGILKSQEPRMTRKDLLEAAVTTKGNWNTPGLSLNLLGFMPTGSGCFVDVKYDPIPDYIQDAVGRGGVLVQTTAAIRVMVPFDPILLAENLKRAFMNDMIVALPSGGYAVYSRQAPIPSGAVEIFQRPLEAGLCISRLPMTKSFHL